jgi:hypothetical protein
MTETSQDVLNWRAGRAAGAAGRPYDPPMESAGRLAWAGGYVEGAAWRSMANNFQPQGVRNMASDYDTDILTWSERQADLLRRAGAGEVMNAQVDWTNVAEEIDSVGRSELHAVESLLVQAILHGLKVDAWPLSIHVPHWEAEIRGFRDEAAHRFTPSMGQRINVAELYTRAVRRMPATIDGLAPLPIPAECAVSLAELLASD